MQIPYLDYPCVLGERATLADTAAAIGRLAAGSRLTLRAYATVRADGEHIRIGDNAYLGERATVHIADALMGTKIGDDVTVGRYALVHACIVGDRVVVGEGSAVMDGASVGDDAVIAADSIVSPGKQLAGGWLYQGVPAQRIREISPDEVAAAARSIRAGAPQDIVRSGALPPLSLQPFLPRGEGARPLHSWLGNAPLIEGAYVAPTAAVIGHVELGQDAGIYFGCVVSARDGRIVIGPRSNVQDNSFLLTTRARGDLILGRGVTIGHNVQMGSGTFGDDALIGMMARVEDRVVVEPGGCIAGGAWVESGTVVKAGWIWAGRPARPFRELRPAEVTEFARGRDAYIVYGAAYRTGPVK